MILATVFIDFLGIGLAYPVIPRLVQELMGSGIGEASVIYALLLSVYAITQFLCAPVVGGLSDRYGRRPVILGALFGLAVDYVLLSVAPTVWWLVLGRVAAGIFGATYTSANAYVADITPPERRAASFGVLGVTVGLGFIAGPALGGLLGAIDLRLPFMTAAAITLLNLTLGILLLPESLAPEHRRPLRFSRMNPVGAIRAVARFDVVLRLLPLFLTAQLVQQAVQALWVPYTTYRFGWSTAEVGVSFTVFAVGLILTQAGAVRPVVKRLGERRTLSVALVVMVAGMVIMGVAPTGAVMYAGILPYCAGLGLLGPAVQSSMSRALPRDEQGLLMGTITSLIAPTAIVAPPIANGIFALFIRPDAGLLVPGAPFFVASVLALLSFAYAVSRSESTERSSPSRLA
ncbi:MAG TPA: TCR/Tet family MFS transporter [Candidatus Limnocylindria bacterium]